MSSPYDAKDYRLTHFEHKSLTKIHDRPDIDSLVQIFRELKRNAQKVPTSLGGGLLGYLGLTLTDAAYTAIPNAVTFLRPTHPGSFVPSGPRITQVEIIQEKAVHEECLRLYNECNRVESTLRTQLIEAIPPIYLEPLRDFDTDMISESIPDIIEYLQRNHCQLTVEELNERETVLKNTSVNPEDPVDIIFNKISKFNNLCTITKRVKTDDMLVDYGYLIFNRCGVFADFLIKWNEKDTEKTLLDFKKHMRKAHAALKTVGKLKIKDSSINMMEQLTAHQERLTEDLGEKLASTVQANLVAALEHLENKENVPQQANLVQSDRALLLIIENLNKKIDALGAQINKNKSPPTSSTTEDKKLINPKTGREYKRYCWTCGCCNHWGNNHPGTKAAGHQDDATFKNRMGGSNKNCLGPARKS